MRRVVLITGAASGIGRAAAAVFQEAGWNVSAVDKEPIELSEGEDMRAYRADVSDEAQVSALFAEIKGQASRLDALVNNAAIQICKPLVEMQVEEWDRVMAVNLRSIFLMARAAYPLLKESRGAIVNVSSVHAVATSKDIAAYAATKGGGLALTRALALEFAGDGIRVNALLPGAVDTPMLRAGLSRGHVSGGSVEARIGDLAMHTPLGRVADPQEMARAILFLADNEQSPFMTGQGLIVDGGATARLSTE